MFHSDVFVSHRLGFILGIDQHIVQRNADILLSAPNFRFLLDQRHHRALEFLRIDLHLPDQFHEQAVIQFRQRIQQMLAVDLRVAVFICQFLAVIDRFDSILRKFIDIHTITTLYHYHSNM